MSKKKICFYLFLLDFACSCLFLHSCKSEKVYKEYVISDLSSSVNDTLQTDNISRVVGVEILIIGELNGEAILEFENGSGRLGRMVLKGKVNQIYETEWYSPQICFNYTPISIVKGDSLKLKYRMF